MNHKSFEEYINAPFDMEPLSKDKKAPKEYPVFKGAVYYKCVSSKSDWLGIEAKITLPEFFPDKTRHENYTNPYGTFLRYLDTPSVYVGGSSDYETDIGFAFVQGLVNGTISKGKITFRPFWRSIYEEDNIEKNVYSGTELSQQSFYYYPGDTVKLDLVCLKPNELSLRIELLEKTKIHPYCDYREHHGNELFILNGIIAPGNGIHNSEYKRVNAIDQYHNEAKPTQETTAKAIGASWNDVCLFHKKDGIIKKVPFAKDKYKQIFSLDKSMFTIKTDQNNEKVNIISFQKDL